MIAFLLRAARALLHAVEWVFDHVYGLLLAAIRGLSVARSSRIVSRVRLTALSFARVTAGAALLASATLAVGWLFFVRVPPGTIGVRQKNAWGRGIVERDYAPGLVFSPRGLEEWHFVDARTELLTFAWASEQGDREMLELRTRDGNLARIGAAVPWRVRSGKGHLLVREGGRGVYRDRVRGTVETVLLQQLSGLSSAELADTDARLARAGLAQAELDARLAEYHVQAEAVLITQVMFGPEYEKKLQQKQLTAQTKLLHEAATLVDKEQEKMGLFQQEIEASLKTIVAAMDQRIEERAGAGRRQIAEISAESKYYDKTRRAEAQSAFDMNVLEGDRALARAEHVKEELANKSWGTSGGRLLLARKAAENLNIRQVTLNSNDPRVPSVLDLDDLVHRLLGPGPTAPEK